jgi:zinc protease
VLVLAGDIGADVGLGLAERLLADWRDPSVGLGAAPASASATQAARPAAAPDATAAGATVLVDMPGAGQSAVVVAAPFVGHRHPQRRIGQVANAVIGGGYSARVNQEVRIRRGLSYGAFSETQVHPDAGLMLASTQTSHAHVAEVLRLLRAEIVRLAEAAPSPEELAARQATLVGSFARRWKPPAAWPR